MKKNIFLWALYDFANTPLVFAIGGLYLGQWIVLDNHFDDIWYGGTFALSSILLLLTAPFWGAWSDKIGKRMPFITRMTIILIFFGVMLAVITTSSFALIHKVIMTLILFLIIQYVYQLSLVLYNTLLLRLSTPKTRGKISGLGEVFNQIGYLLTPIILLPFATGKITLIGESGRAQVFLPATLLLMLFGLPMVFWFRESKTKGQKENSDFKAISRKTIQGLKYLIRKNKNVTIFLIAFMFISDALLTANLYFAIFMDQIYKISDTQKVIIVILLQIFTIISAYLLGKISDAYGIKKIIVLACISMIISFLLIVILSNIWALYLFTPILGIGWGGFYVMARALLVKLSPVSSLGEYFGFYSTFQRFASIIGPLMWGGVTLVLRDYGVIKYRIAGLSLIFLMAIGTLLLTRVREERT